MWSASEYQFANCRVLSHTREVWLDGALQEVPPRVFDLLLYLLKYNDRVVSKDEILEEIWLGRVVTDNVISRAIMIARGVIGDSKTSPVLIKTVQRVGYRFIGTISTKANKEALNNLPRARPVLKSTIRLALLPFQNNTGSSELAWVELGLPTLVNQALRHDARVEVLSATAVLSALEDCPPRLSAKELPAHVSRVLGATCLIETTVTRIDQEYLLEYLAHGEHGTGIFGRQQGAELTGLAQMLARVIARHLFGEETSMVLFESNEPFVNECFARAMQALDRDDSTEALDLMRVVRRLEPDSSAVELAYLSALSAAGHEDSFKLAEQLIERGRESSDSYMENAARKILATLLREDRRDPEAADRVLDRLFAVEAPNPMQDWYVDALLTRARIRTNLADRAPARDILNQVLALSDEIKNQMLRVSAMNSLAVIEARDGNLWQAREAFREVCDLFANIDKPLGRAVAESNLAITNFNLGLIDDAVAVASDAMRRMSQLAVAPQRFPNAVLSAAMMFSHAHETQQIAQLLHHFSEGEWSKIMALDEVEPSVVRGFHRYSLGDLDAAADMFVEAIDTALAKNKKQEMTLIPIVVLNLVTAARFDDAHRVRAMLDPSARLMFPWVPGALLHADAIEASIKGQHVAARDALLSAFELAAGGFSEALIRIDLAWVHLCAGRVADARTLCTPIAPWMTQHAAGMVVLAVLEHDAGRVGAASRAMHAHLKKVGGIHRSRFSGLLDVLLETGSARQSLDLSAFLQLPTTYLLQRPARAATVVVAHDRAAIRASAHETSRQGCNNIM